MPSDPRIRHVADDVRRLCTLLARSTRTWRTTEVYGDVAFTREVLLRLVADQLYGDPAGRRQGEEETLRAARALKR